MHEIKDKDWKKGHDEAEAMFPGGGVGVQRMHDAIKSTPDQTPRGRTIAALHAYQQNTADLLSAVVAGDPDITPDVIFKLHDHTNKNQHVIKKAVQQGIA